MAARQGGYDCSDHLGLEDDALNDSLEVNDDNGDDNKLLMKSTSAVQNGLSSSGRVASKARSSAASKAAHQQAGDVTLAAEAEGCPDCQHVSQWLSS